MTDKITPDGRAMALVHLRLDWDEHRRLGERFTRHAEIADAYKRAIDLLEADGKVPEVPTMTIDGVRYVEKNRNSCRGCAFQGQDRCEYIATEAARVFGDGCYGASVIYVEADEVTR